MKPLEGYHVEREGSHAVALELEIDESLRVEGWARDIVRAVQNARQHAGLEISDRILLTLDGDDELLAAARDPPGLHRRRDAGHDGQLRAPGRRRAGDDRRPAADRSASRSPAGVGQRR